MSVRALAAVAALVLSAPAAMAETIRLEIARADASFDPRTAQPVLNIVLTPASGRAFGRFTAARVGLTIQLRVDGKVMSSPRINEPILGGALQISGLDDVAQAQALAIAVREGAAAVEVEGPDK